MHVAMLPSDRSAGASTLQDAGVVSLHQVALNVAPEGTRLRQIRSELALRNKIPAGSSSVERDAIHAVVELHRRKR